VLPTSSRQHLRLWGELDDRRRLVVLQFLPELLAIRDRLLRDDKNDMGLLVKWPQAMSQKCLVKDLDLRRIDRTLDPGTEN
jgi:hypothetical protein